MKYEYKVSCNACRWYFVTYNANINLIINRHFKKYGHAEYTLTQRMVPDK